MLLCTYHMCILCTEALREAHSRFSLKTQEEDGLFQKRIRVGAPFCPLAAQRNQPLGLEVGFYRYLHFSSFSRHPLSVSIITQLNKHWHFAGGRWADADEAEMGMSCHELLLAFLGSLNILKVRFWTFKATLKLSAYALASCTVPSS